MSWMLAIHHWFVMYAFDVKDTSGVKFYRELYQRLPAAAPEDLMVLFRYLKEHLTKSWDKTYTMKESMVRNGQTDNRMYRAVETRLAYLEELAAQADQDHQMLQNCLFLKPETVKIELGTMYVDNVPQIERFVRVELPDAA